MSRVSAYRPKGWLLRNPHLQSIISSTSFRKNTGKRALEKTGAQTTEHLVDAGDGVRLQGFYSKNKTRSRGLILLLHGWEGCSDSSYMCHTAARLLNAGFNVFRLNFRDHGDTHHLNEGLFHSCRLQEVVNAARWVHQQFPAPVFMAAGYSLGGNFALRLALAAPEAGIPLHHAVAVCPAVDPSNVMKALEAGLPLYHWYFMKKWRSSLLKKRALFPQQHNFADTILKQNMRGLTGWLVERHTDKKDVEDYFSGYSVADGRLAHLQVPVSVLAAADDPVIPIATLENLQLPSHSLLEIAEYGGHCAFIEGSSLRGYAERWVAQRLALALGSIKVAESV
jgi:uncharacterized protein